MSGFFGSFERSIYDGRSSNFLLLTKLKRTNFKFNPNGGQAIDTNAFGADLREPGRDFDFF